MFNSKLVERLCSSGVLLEPCKRHSVMKGKLMPC
jgi:hypothetical protein